MIDELDARLIELLAAEPRAGMLEASRRLGVARGTVQARLDRMQAAGVITSYGPDVEPAALDHPVMAFVTLEIRQVGGHVPVAARLAAVPEVLEAHTITGSGDMLCRVVARSNADLQRVIDAMVAAPGVLRTSTVIVLNTAVRYRVLPLVRAVARERLPWQRATVAGSQRGNSMAENQTATAEPVFGRSREVMVVLPGLLLTLIIAMLDQLVVSTALPRIVGDLGGLTHLSWVVTAYVLAATITTPIYGKLGDMYGRKRLLMIAIVVFLIGSALSGLAHSMDQLIEFRALQGLGAGGLMVGAIATIGDMVSPRERGQYMGYMMAAMTLAMIAGPLVGGYITDNLSWRWIFYLNMPIGGAALVYLAVTMHLPRRHVEHRVDYLGSALLAIAATAIVLVTTWGGTQYAWASAPIVALVAVGVLAIAAFVVVETRVAEPVLPPHVFRNRNFSLSTAMAFLLGLAMFGALTFLPLYQQTVQHLSATGSGMMLIPMMLGATVTSLIAGAVTTRTGRYKALPIIGGAIMVVAMYLLTHLGPDTSRLTAAIYYVVLGIGMGFLMQITTLIVQNSVELKDMGVASSSRTFFQQIGGSIGVSLFGAIFASRLAAAMSSRLPGFHMSAGGGQLDPVRVNSLPGPVRDAAFYAISHAVSSVFEWAIPAAALVVALAVCIQEIPLRSSEEGTGAREMAADGGVGPQPTGEAAASELAV